MRVRWVGGGEGLDHGVCEVLEVGEVWMCSVPCFPRKSVHEGL